MNRTKKIREIQALYPKGIFSSDEFIAKIESGKSKFLIVEVGRKNFSIHGPYKFVCFLDSVILEGKSCKRFKATPEHYGEYRSYNIYNEAFIDDIFRTGRACFFVEDENFAKIYGVDLSENFPPEEYLGV